MHNWLEKLEDLKRQGKPCVLATVVGSSGSTPREAGAKMIVLSDSSQAGGFFGTIGGGHLEALAIDDAKKCLAENSSKTIEYPLGAKTGQCCGGVVQIFMEVLNNGPQLYLFGAGHVAQALCKSLVGTPFTVHIIDERKEWVMSNEIPQGAIRHHVEWDDYVDEAVWDSDKTYVAIMTHGHDHDQAIVEDVIERKAFYIGLIGSEPKWKRFQDRLVAKGVSQKKLDRVKCPIGLDIGGKAPQEIAISVAAELVSTFYDKKK